MRKPETNEDNVQMSDVLCDFCHGEWTDDIAMVEGHRGSAICGKCLLVAYTDVVMEEHNTAPEGYTCTLCLEVREDNGWASPVYDEAAVCRRCLKQAGAILHKDDLHAWKKPST